MSQGSHQWSEAHKKMGGVDLSDQMNLYHKLAKNSFKWWKKIVFDLLLTAVVSSHILHLLTAVVRSHILHLLTAVVRFHILHLLTAVVRSHILHWSSAVVKSDFWLQLTEQWLEGYERHSVAPGKPSTAEDTPLRLWMTLHGASWEVDRMCNVHRVSNVHRV